MQTLNPFCLFAIIFHEICHYLVALILRVDVSRFRINYDNSDKVLQSEGFITAAVTFTFRDILVFLAPTYLFVVAIILCIISQSWFIFTYLWIYRDYIWLQKQDTEAFKFWIKGKYNYENFNELKNNINNHMKN